jgi:alpha,alpha-trehalose phosphorylase
VRHKPAAISIDRQRFPVDEWRLVEARLGDDDGGLTGTLFAIGNGYIGMRADWAPDPRSAGTYVNGFHETFPIRHAEHAHALARTGQSILDAPDAKSLRLEVGGDVLHLAADHHERSDVADFERSIDFRAGVLRSEFTWTTSAGARLQVVSERIVSLAHRHRAALRLSITMLSGSAPVTITAELVNRQDLGTGTQTTGAADPRRGRTFDHRVLQPVHQHHEGASPGDSGTVTLGFRCAESGMSIVAAVRHLVDAAGTPQPETVVEPDRSATEVRFELDQGGAATFTTHVAYHTAGQVPGASPPATIEQLVGEAQDTLAAAVDAGWQATETDQRSWLDEFWRRTDIAVGGDPSAQQAIRWNLFQMAQASAQVGPRGIAAKAVTAGGYDGHYFWDTEIYVLPLLAYNNPAAARDLLGFRYLTLPRARERATEMSQRGALYPWRTINGEEASAYYPAGTAQYHIDADVAYAIDRYFTATGDTEYLHGEGAEILVELARLFADLGFYDHADPPRFHIHGVTGPDEYTAVVDDNVYTNVMARFTLRFAASVVESVRSTDPARFEVLSTATGVGVEEIDAWKLAADSMCVLYDEELGINPQDASFLRHEAWDWEGTPDECYPLLLNFHPLVIYRHQVLKQADVVLANFLRGDEFASEVQRRNFDYYDAITTGDSSLSACVQSIMASEVGRPELAMHYFTQSLYLDIADTHGNTVDGAHIANVGGVWAGLVHGFAGVRDSIERLRVAPRLPAEWTSIGFRLHRRGSDISILVDRDGATVTVESGEAVPIGAGDTITMVAPGDSLRVPASAS